MLNCAVPLFSIVSRYQHLVNVSKTLDTQPVSARWTTCSLTCCRLNSVWIFLEWRNCQTKRGKSSFNCSVIANYCVPSHATERLVMWCNCTYKLKYILCLETVDVVGKTSITFKNPLSGLSLCWFSSLLRRFFSGFSGFPPSAKTNIQLIPAGCKLCSKVTHGPYSGCQRHQCMYAFSSTLLSCVVAVLCDGN